MSHLSAKQGQQGISAPDTDSVSSGWMHSMYQDTLDGTIPAMQQQEMPFLRRRITIVAINDAEMANNYITSLLRLVESSKSQGWSKPDTPMACGSEARPVVKAATESVQKRRHVADWHRATKLVSYREMLAGRLHELFLSANNEVFEDGMTSRFSDELRRIVREHGITAVKQIGAAIRAEDTSVKVAEEALRQVGYTNDEKTHNVRLSLLKISLESHNIRIRDAASIGVEAMEDPAAIPALKRAIENEQAGWLRQYQEDVMNQLLKTQHEVPEES